MVKLDLQGSAIRFEGGKELPLRRFTVDPDAVDVQLTGIEEDVARLALSSRLQPVDNISGQLSLVKEDLEVGCNVSGQPIVVVRQGVRIARRVDDGGHTTGLFVQTS